MGFKEFKEEYKAKAKIIEDEHHKKQEERTRPSETEKLAKTGSFIIKGIALWYIIPALAVMLIVAIAGVVWIWDMIF